MSQPGTCERGKVGTWERQRPHPSNRSTHSGRRSHAPTFPPAHWRAAAALALCLLVAPGVLRAGEPLSQQRQREILRSALTAYDQAVAVARENPDEARQLYRQAAGGLLALRDAGGDNAAVEYNLGNIYFRLGELGRAVLHYRRAERLAPGDPRLRANLRFARDRVEPVIVPTGQGRLVRSLLFWHYDTSPRQRFVVLVVASGAGWLLLLGGLLWRRRPLVLIAAPFLVAMVAVSGSLLWQLHDETRRPPAVVVGNAVPLRLGRGEGADLALKQPLGPGVELRLLRQHGEWVEVQLANDQTGWLPAQAVEPL